MDYDEFAYFNWSLLDSNLELEESFSSSSPSIWFHIIFQMAYGLIFLIGLSGNSFLIYVVFRFFKLRTVTNQYIVNVAIANICFTSGLPFLITTAVLGHWPFGNLLCKMYFTMTSTNHVTIPLFFIVLTVDRYFAVCHPINGPKYRYTPGSKLVIIFVWILSVVLVVPVFMYANTLDIDDRANCNIFWPESATMSGEMIYIIYMFNIGFAVPIFIIFIFYILTLRRFINDGAQNYNSKQNEEREVTKLVLSGVTVHFICWTPYWALQVLLIVLDEASHSFVIFFILAGILSYSTSATFPILCFLLSKNLKKSVKEACFCCKKEARKNPEDTAELNLISVTET